MSPQTMTLPPVVGHRGAKGHAPENTLASIAMAARLGVRWVEFDTKLSRDGHVVVFHDDEVDRTTNGAGLIGDMDLAEIQTLDAGSWFGDEFAGEGVPTLVQAMKALDQLGLGANVEIKPSKGLEEESGRVVASMLNNQWPRFLPPPLISSFSAEALAAARATAPAMERALLVLDVPGDWRSLMSQLGCSALHCVVRSTTPGLVREVLAEGWAFRCFTVNSKRKAEKLFCLGVETVYSDYPERIVSGL
ncbi:MAG: glycerophosphodiester phosphodiesterase [Rhodospirillales bacterium]